MKRIVSIVIAFCSVCGSYAAENEPQKPDIPAVMVGVMAGRDGAAFGPGISVQGNLWRLGLYGFAGRSSVGGYTTGDGVTADFTDRTLGFGIVFRAIQVHRFTFGAFGQAAYYGSHVKATYFDPDYQMTVEYRDSSRDPLITIGPDISYRIANGIYIMLRPGKDFGENFAATTAGGFSMNGGILVDGMRIYGGVAKVRKLFH